MRNKYLDVQRNRRDKGHETWVFLGCSIEDMLGRATQVGNKLIVGNRSFALRCRPQTVNGGPVRTH